MLNLFQKSSIYETEIFIFHSVNDVRSYNQFSQNNIVVYPYVHFNKYHFIEFKIRSYAELRINLIPFRYLMLIIPC